MRKVSWSICVMTILLASQPAVAQRTLNRGLHAAPAPKTVEIDGDLSEWDTSGAIICCKDVTASLDTESVKVAAMWDAENLYLAFDFRDSTPMQNKIDPATMPGNGWRSDCVQLRCNMAGFVSHVDMWYYTTGKQPSMTIHYGRFGGNEPKVDRPGDPTKLGAVQAFKMAEDKLGYTQEVKMPWAVLTQDGKCPARDADIRLGLEMFWGDISAEGWPRSRVTDNLSDGATQTDFFWTAVDNWGRLILEDKNNLTLPPPAWQLARKAEPRGLAPITFDLPRDSFVTIAIEDAAGNRVNSLLGGVKLPKGKNTVYWSGLDDRNSPLPAGDYKWVGLYRDQLDVKWLMSFYQPNEETPWGNADGTGAWGPDHGSLKSVAAGDGRIYLAANGIEAGYALFAVSPTGKKLWTVKMAESDRVAYADGMVYAYAMRRGVNFLGIAAGGVVQVEAATGKWIDIPGHDGKPVKRLPLEQGDESLHGFAADAAGLYASVTGKGIVRSYDRKTFKQVRQYTVPAAGHLFAPGKGKLLVTTPQALLELDLADGTLKSLITADLGTAQAVTASGDTVYVALGSPHHNVLALKRNGDTLKAALTIGKKGGRAPNGWYDPKEGFINPSGVAVDIHGQLWVVEDHYKPKRVSTWANGQWVRDFIGDTGYGGGGIINPLDPTMAFYDAMQFKIDLDKGTSKLVQVGMIVPDNAAEYGVKIVASDAGTTEYMMAFKGRAYVHNCRDARAIYRELPKGVGPGLAGRWALCVFIDPRNKIAWIDLDDDCKISENEIMRGGEKDDWGGTDYWGMRPSQDMDLFFTRGVQRPGLRLRVRRFTAGGTPVYDLAKFEPMGGECQNGVGLRGGSYNSGCAGERGDYFSEMRRIETAAGKPRTFWYRGESTGRWTYRLPAPGLVLYPFQAHGVIDAPSIKGEVVCWVSDFGQRYLFTDDMLYIDQLFADARSGYENWPDNPKRGFLANKMAPGQESFHGFFTRAKDGRCLLTSGFTDCRVFEVTGLDSMKRIGGSVELKKEYLARAAEIREFRLAGGKMRGNVTVVKPQKTVKVDGMLDEWSRDNAVQIKVDPRRGADVLTSYDNENLYIAWEAQDASPMANKAQNWQLAFRGGDCVDVMFRRPGDKLDDAALRAGDMRLLITMLDGKPAAILYRPVSDAKQPYTFDAFEGAGRGNAVKMDEVRLADEVHTAVKIGPQGYIVEAAVPWKLLGAQPKPAMEFRMDFGVLFGDAMGSATALRAYWENLDTQIVADIPSEAALKPANWGVAKIAE